MSEPGLLANDMIAAGLRWKVVATDFELRALLPGPGHVVGLRQPDERLARDHERLDRDARTARDQLQINALGGVVPLLRGDELTGVLDVGDPAHLQRRLRLGRGNRRRQPR